MLQAEVCEPRMALTRRLYGTVAVMSSVMSHSGSLVDEHQLLGIQMWLRYRLSYSLAKEMKAQPHNSPCYTGSMMVASNCLIHSHFMSQQNTSKHLFHTPVPPLCSMTSHSFFLTPSVTGKGNRGVNPNVSRSLHLHVHHPSLSYCHPLHRYDLLTDCPASTPAILQTIHH